MIRFSIFKDEDGIYESLHGEYVLYQDARNLEHRVEHLEQQLEAHAKEVTQLEAVCVLYWRDLGDLRTALENLVERKEGAHVQALKILGRLK